MKPVLDPKKLPLGVGLLGVLGLVLRQLILALATDSRGLLISGHPLVIALLVLAAATAALVALTVPGLGGGRKYAANFPPSASAALGCGILALGLMVTAALSLERSSLGYLRYGLGLASGSCLIFLAYARYRGINTNFLMHIVVCAFFAVHMVSRYRPWSGDPALLDYVFEVFAAVGLMLFAYHQAAFQLGRGKRRTQLFTGLLTGFCCLVCLPGCGAPLLYFGGAAWTLSNLCILTPPPRRKKVAPEAPRDDNHETS